MRLTRLHLKDFRGFADLTLDLHPRLTLLVGVNGAGKSSVLDAIAGTVAQASSDERRDAVSYWGETDVREGASFCSVSLGLLSQSSSESAADDRLVTLGRRRVDDAYLHAVEASPDLLIQSDQVELAHFSPDGLPANTLQARVVARQLDARAFRQWFLRWENEENARRLEGDERYRDPVLETFRRAVRPFFGDVRVRFNRKRDDLVLVREGMELGFETLSTGERMALALAGEIARLLSERREDDPQAANAELIVLIDEVEQHLHPAWQRKILPTLLGAFPNIQIVATTHSPQVVASVPAEHVRKLRDGKVYLLGEPTEGRDSNALLEDVFETPPRPQDVIDQIKEVEEMIDAPDLDTARIKLAALRRRLGDLDEDVVRLEVHLDAAS